MVICMCVNWEAWNAIATTIACVVAIAAALIAWYQYNSASEHQRESTRSKILADYNWHYMQNRSIELVVKALIDKDFEKHKVHVYDIELFLRFFEELYLLIHSKNRMKPEIAKSMFSYYAILAWDTNDLWQKLATSNKTTIDVERNSEDWLLFRLFVNEMKNMNIKNLSI